jgi:hypothetical protein
MREIFYVEDRFKRSVFMARSRNQAIAFAKDYTIEHCITLYIWFHDKCIVAIENGKEI